MKLTLNLPPATLEKLQAEALATGKDVETLVREAVEAKLARRARKFAEILKPIHDEVETSGMSVDEVNALADETVAEARAERNSTRNQQ